MSSNEKRLEKTRTFGENAKLKRIKMALPGLEYFRQVKAEVKKITWPSRHETIVSTIAVFVMVFVASVFLYFADQVMAWLVWFVMNLGI
jgi:preprotein translocase subunit SecE